ncbi:MAG: hypothetical protein JWM11_3264 [Planctomycetaceae bacterium]|nr:hypothetical protein [Planctomycetaceae bacterium]
MIKMKLMLHRKVLVWVGAIVCLSLAVIIAATKSDVIRSYRGYRAYGRLMRCVDELYKRTPSEVTPARWRCMVGWAGNGIGNCCSNMHMIRDEKRFEQFIAEFERREAVDACNDLETMRWIWSEIGAVSFSGTSYFERWEPLNDKRHGDCQGP